MPAEVRVVGGEVRAVSQSQDLAFRIAVEGRKFYSSDGDQNDLVLGQTSFANTTPTFLLRNRLNSNIYVLPLFVLLNQSGTVAGGAVDIIAEFDTDQYASAGTSEKVANAWVGHSRVAEAQLYTGPTATAGYGIRVDGITTGQDVSPAEGALQQYLWTPTSVMDIMQPGTCMKVFTYAATTGPSWFWQVSWAEIPRDWLAYLLEED